MSAARGPAHGRVGNVRGGAAGFRTAA
jgi:hypothetical protein